MVKKAAFYIIYNYFKYILIILLLFIGIIWLSQILRLLEFQYSISNQIMEVAFTTLLALPSFINPLVPFMILIGSFMLNNKIKNSNEVIILKQYLNIKSLNILFQIIILLIFVIFILNNEIFSKKFYEKYKIKELEIRNNLKLGNPYKNEFHIDNKVSIFFEDKIDEVFYKVETIIYDDNQFIISDSVLIELSKSNFNLVFFNGERLILNKSEKSKTIFDKFTYVLEDKKYEKLLFDKDHFNTLELLFHPNEELNNHGHYKIFQYFFLFVICLISLRIIFFYINKKSNIHHFTLLTIIVILVQVFNSYMIYLLNNNSQFGLIYFYLGSFVVLTFSLFTSKRILK
jgi:lipopolysaccharide export LptBFGC system permease protein LptF